MDTTIQREKVEQARDILEEQGIDCWLTFARETTETPDPVMDLIVGHDVTWQSAFIVTRDGKRIAIVGGPDGGLITQAGLYATLHTYDASVTPVLRAVMRELDPKQIAINYSVGDVAADGLTHGMYLQLVAALARSPYRQRLISAAPVIAALRSRKTATELRRMREAIRITEELFAKVTPFLRPGRTERNVADMLHAELKRRGLATSWQADACPAVNAGASSEAGHGGPTEIVMRAGDLIHLDFGIIYEDYCSDLQRMWFLRGDGAMEPPEEVTRAFRACVGAIEAGRKKLKAGVQGYQVDAAARNYLMGAGFPEYMHALGHGVGRAVHDGGPLIGPRWPRYGETPERSIEPNSVYTLELGAATSRGYLGLEDEVLVSASGATWLSTAQAELIMAG
jgi:Xaa-Pro aminopeptidase